LFKPQQKSPPGIRSWEGYKADMKVLVFNCRKVLEINCRKLLVSTCFLHLIEEGVL
jgi:hypothetical protein